MYPLICVYMVSFQQLHKLRDKFLNNGMDPSCATTCANRFGFSFCSELCSTDGVCACPAGTIIDEDSNECVPQNKCPESM